MEAAKIKKGSSEPNRNKVAKVTWEAIRKIAEDKMDQNEKLSKLRAGVSLAKADKPGITAIEIDE